MNTDETKRRLRRARKHAERGARRAIRGAGSRRDVARALKRSESTVSHEATSRSHPELTRALEMAMLLNGGRDTTARALAQEMMEAVDLSEVILEDTDRLTARGLYLLDREDLLEADENRASRSGVGYSDALRAEGWAQIELAGIHDELLERNVDLLELDRERKAAA